MPLLFEEISFAPRIKDSERVLTIEVECYTCPICQQPCFADMAALTEHMKLEHPLQFWFWYWTYDTIPAGKLLTGASIVTGMALIFAAMAKAPKKVT